MGAPYTSQSISGYNSNPPPDDGSQTEANRIKHSTTKTKLADPIKTLAEAIDTAALAAFGKVIGGGGVTSTAIAYQIISTDQGKLVKVTGSGSITVTTPDATDVGSPFVFAFSNQSTGNVTFDGSGSQTVNGSANLTVPPGSGFICFTDGTNWFTTGQSGGAPTTQTFLSGSAATYNRPTGVVRLRVRMVGGGGGGSGGGATAGTGSAGGNTSFSTFAANGGAAAGTTTGGAGGSGGAGTGIIRVPGGQGYCSSGALGSSVGHSGGGGGNSFFGGGATTTIGANTGGTGSTNTGGGGGGGGINNSATAQSGSGGGAGEFVEFSITNPSATYTYTVGAGGGGGSAGTNGASGGAGAAGMIVVEEFYS